MMDPTTKPAQFRLPLWAHEFLAQEASASGTTKTDVVVDAIESYRAHRVEQRLAEGYVALRDVMREECAEWDATLVDGAEDESW